MGFDLPQRCAYLLIFSFYLCHSAPLSPYMCFGVLIQTVLMEHEELFLYTEAQACFENLLRIRRYTGYIMETINYWLFL